MDYKLFGLWDANVNVTDIGLKPYINLDPVIIPKSAGRNRQRFHKAMYTNIVERLICKLRVSGHRGKKHRMSSGHNTSKSIKTYNIIVKTFKKIENELKMNPIEVFVKALENAAPREEITSIEYGGARYPQAVETSPQRRIDLALRQMTQGAYSKSFNNKKDIASCLADEIIKAYKMDQGSQAIAKKLELERQASSSR
ncbi:MAG: 30S ribosomal protein S7 [Nanoarchaeota archaeon]|nr:30S ribosomal protein S7 [Nanoarchaeota archaeon]MBU0962510.1 30S ribosomal protein S7 [Nanoarchaeota archaeon]